MRTVLFALFATVAASAQVVEDFEHGNESLYAFANNGTDTLNLVAAAAHDGALGAELAGSGGPAWRLRTDVTTSPGNVYEHFVRARGAPGNTGRTYVGFGATANGAWSAVFATNTGEIQIQDNTGWSFVTVATVPATLLPDTWYRLRLDWALNGDMTLDLLDETGVSVLATTGVVSTGFTTSGGIALRGFSTDSATVFDIDTISGPPSTPTAYCTAGTSSNNCTPSISAANQPSVSQAAPCVITVTGVEGQKSGLVFYGIDNTGFAPLPWSPTSTSLFCVKSPVQRTPAQSSGGTVGQCNGQLTLDWDAFQAAFPGSLGTPFSLGDKAFAQAWYRDPPAPRTTNLSNALELTHVP